MHWCRLKARLWFIYVAAHDGARRKLCQTLRRVRTHGDGFDTEASPFVAVCVVHMWARACTFATIDAIQAYYGAGVASTKCHRSWVVLEGVRVVAVWVVNYPSPSVWTDREGRDTELLLNCWPPSIHPSIHPLQRSSSSIHYYAWLEMKSNSFMFFGLQFLCWLLCANVDVIWQRISINQDQLLMLAQIQFAALLMGWVKYLGAISLGEEINCFFLLLLFQFYLCYFLQ